MEHARYIVDKIENQSLVLKSDSLRCNHCGQVWSANYSDYAGMQDLDFIICSCGQIVCQVSELKVV